MANYPLPKFHFQVEWGGAKIGFSEVSGLDVSVEAIEYRDGASPEYHKIKMPGLQSFSNITMNRAVLRGDNCLYDWGHTVAQTTIERRDLIICLLDESHATVVGGKIKSARPLRGQATDLNSTGNDVDIETIEIAHEGLTNQNE